MTPEQVKALRKRLGWSQLKLSHYLHTTPATIYRWESGRSPVEGPALRALESLAEKELV